MVLRFSVLIATAGVRNTIERCIDSVAGLDIPGGCEWECLLVDNSSHGVTFDVARWEKRLPLRILREEQPGHSGALNLGLENSRGEVVLITDDDATVEPGWAKAYLRECEFGTYGYLFGPIRPIYSLPPPPHYKELAPRSLGGLNLGSCSTSQFDTERDSNPVGVNMALPRMIIKQGYRFHPLLGPSRKGDLVSGADTYLASQLRASGMKGRYVADALVDHLVPNERTFFRYLLRRKEAVGRAAVVYDPAVPGRRCFGAPWPLWVRLAYLTLQTLLLHFSPNTLHYQRTCLLRARLKGTLWGYRRDLRNRVLNA